MNIAHKKTIIFNLVPIHPSLGQFSKRVHPASLVSYRTRNEVLAKLCDMFLNGKIEVNELNSIMSSGYDTWKHALYNYLPADEQVYHEYLAHADEKISLKSPEKRYLDDEITLSDYEDLKFPERKKKKDLEKAGYPRPYTYGPCKICSSPEGLIKCNTCDSLVCTACVAENFLNPPTAIGSFLLMHRIFCMRFGIVHAKSTHVEQEPAFLRTMRNTGREQALARLLPLMNKNDDEEREVSFFIVTNTQRDRQGSVANTLHR